MRMLSGWRGMGIGLVLLSMACDDNSSGYSSDVDKNKQLSQLTASELQQVCGGAAQYLADDKAVKELSCKFSVLTTLVTSGVTACQTAYEQCVSSDAGTTDQGDGGAQADGGVATCQVPATCTATVEDYNKCITDGRKAIDDYNQSLKSCEVNALSSNNSANLQEPDSCKNLREKCTGLYTGLPGLSNAQ